MKIKITRPDGTIIEAEGTTEECGRIASPLRDVVSPMHAAFDRAPVEATLIQAARDAQKCGGR